MYRAIKTKRKIIELRSVSQKKHNESLFDMMTVNAAGDVRLAFREKKGVNRRSEMKRKVL
ncbi:hypothetical protein BADSM9389_36310 [Buttiauxella agrestis]|nr:hypothetical protein BADSM9389_36310 [Buttiauxella agrestis]